jgi:hypothetical protein
MRKLFHCDLPEADAPRDPCRLAAQIPHQACRAKKRIDFLDFAALGRIWAGWRHVTSILVRILCPQRKAMPRRGEKRHNT